MRASVSADVVVGSFMEDMLLIMSVDHDIENFVEQPPDDVVAAIPDDPPPAPDPDPPVTITDANE